MNVIIPVEVRLDLMVTFIKVPIGRLPFTYGDRLFSSPR